MTGLIKVLVTFFVCLVSFILLAITYETDEYSPFVPVFAFTGLASFFVSLMLFLVI